MPSQLALYEQLTTLHDEMADAAFAADWDRLIQLELQSAELTQVLQKSGAKPAPPEERRPTAALIEHIIKKQTLIRDEIKAWRDDAAPLLAVLNRGRSS